MYDFKRHNVVIDYILSGYSFQNVNEFLCAFHINHLSVLSSSFNLISETALSMDSPEKWASKLVYLCRI